MHFKNLYFTAILLSIFLTNVTGQKASEPQTNLIEINQQSALAAFSQQQKAVVAEGVLTNGFGTSVSISGTTAVVGSPFDDQNGNKDQGAAFVYVRNFGVWTLQARLVASDAAANDLFGSSVAISGETIVIGATKADGASINSGAAYVFTRSGSTWTQQAKLNADNGLTDDNFGASAAINGNTVAVGATLDDIGTGAANVDKGSTYIFVRSGTNWTQQASLSDPNGVSLSNFGCSLALNGENLVVGANGFQGFAYLFVRS
ncbi:MAG: hypothetical protein H7Z37_08255, partial [Pyrinomonadaceae bacterium]|nr:hypothetical protein [Pyrinomonadaceae bacterium]